MGWAVVMGVGVGMCFPIFVRYHSIFINSSRFTEPISKSQAVQLDVQFNDMQRHDTSLGNLACGMCNCFLRNDIATYGSSHPYFLSLFLAFTFE